MLDFSTRYFAHRGLHTGDSNVPENSLTAFRLAVEAGYGIELDLQLTADNKVVVFHDSTLTRMCCCGQSINDYTYEELQFFSLLDSKEKIPLFTDVLAIVRGAVPMIIEIKDVPRKKELMEKAMEILDSYPGSFCIESFHPWYLLWLKKHRPYIRRGQLSMNFPRFEPNAPHPRLLRSMILNLFTRPDFIAIDYRSRHMRTFRFWKKHSTPVAWTIRTEEELTVARRYFDYFIFEYIRP